MTLISNVEKKLDGVAINFIKNEKQKIIDALLKNEIKSMVDHEVDRGKEAIVDEVNYLADGEALAVDVNNSGTVVPAHEEI